MTLNTIPHMSSNTLCHLNISLRHFVSNTNKPKLHESCSTKSKPYSMLQIKNFLCCVVKEKFRHSFVLSKKYSVREINNFPKLYKASSTHPQKVCLVWLNYIQWKGLQVWIFGECGITTSLLWNGVVVPVWVPLMSQIDLLWDNI